MFKLPTLPYQQDDLTPHLSKETLEFHYGKHHKAYVDNLNKLIQGTPQEKASLEEIVQASSGGIYNNSAQAWNHTFYWFGLTSSKSRSKSEPTGKLAEAVKRDFGSFSALKDAYKDNATKVFGSGWTWLVKDKTGKLSFVNTSNADGPLKTDLVPIHVCDVWEHAYYIDYRNVRANYFDHFWDVIDWNFCEKNYDAAKPFNATAVMRA